MLWEYIYTAYQIKSTHSRIALVKTKTKQKQNKDTW